MQRQRFITTIKNLTEGKKKLKSLIRFNNANKINNYSEGGGGGRIKKGNKKSKRNPRESTKQVKT